MATLNSSEQGVFGAPRKGRRESGHGGLIKNYINSKFCGNQVLGRSFYRQSIGWQGSLFTEHFLRNRALSVFIAKGDTGEPKAASASKALRALTINALRAFATFQGR